MKTRKESIKEKIGKPPGTLIYTGHLHSGAAKLVLTKYSPEGYQIEENLSYEEALDGFEDGKVNWLNVIGLSDVETVRGIGQRLGLHSLVLEDILHVNQLPKIEVFDDYLFITLKYLYYNEAGEIGSDHFSMVLGKSYIISFQETDKDYLRPIFDRIISTTTKVKLRKADYLVYYLIDLMADHYFLVQDKLEEEADKIEMNLYEGFEKDVINRINTLQKRLTELKRLIQPLKDALLSLKRFETDFVEEYVIHYLNDVLDHLKHLEDTLNSRKEMLSGLTDLYMSMQSNKMNRVMYTLTLVATIFIPLTFLAGIYGMNFDNMPELHYKYAYFILLGFMVVAGIIILIFMKRRKWL